MRKKPYLLVYMLGRNEQHWKKIYEIAGQKHLQVRTIPVFMADLNREGCLKNPISPPEFLAYIQNADYICTDSFHGLAFSVNFHKEFTVFERFKKNDRLNQNSRIYNLLQKLHLEGRLYRNQKDIEMLSETIDYVQTDKIRDVLMQESIQYLERSLQSAVQHKSDKKKHIQSDYSLCCGCGVCEAVCPSKAIQIKRNQAGFYQAFVDNHVCISCGKCRKVCPYIERSNNQKITDANLYSFKSNSDEVLSVSSSGGAAFHIASKNRKFSPSFIKVLDFSDKYSYECYLTHQFFILNSMSLMNITQILVVNILLILILTFLTAWVVKKMSIYLQKNIIRS